MRELCVQKENNELCMIGYPHNSSNRCQDTNKMQAKTELRTDETLFWTGNRIRKEEKRKKESTPTIEETNPTLVNISTSPATTPPQLQPCTRQGEAAHVGTAQFKQVLCLVHLHRQLHDLASFTFLPGSWLVVTLSHPSVQSALMDVLLICIVRF